MFEVAQQELVSSLGWDFPGPDATAGAGGDTFVPLRRCHCDYRSPPAICDSPYLVSIVAARSNSWLRQCNPPTGAAPPDCVRIADEEPVFVVGPIPGCHLGEGCELGLRAALAAVKSVALNATRRIVA